MIPGPTADAGGPKRFASGRRSLYTDPFVELQGRKPDSAPMGRTPSVPIISAGLLPPMSDASLGGAAAPFPIEAVPFPIEESTTPDEPASQTGWATTGSDEAHSDTVVQGSDEGLVVTQESYTYTDTVHGHIETYREEIEVVRQATGEIVHQEHYQYFTEQPTELYTEPSREDNKQPSPYLSATQPLIPASPDNSFSPRGRSPRLRSRSGGSASQFPLSTPVSDVRLATHPTELSAIDPVEELGLTTSSRLHMGATPWVTRAMLPRSDSDWFQTQRRESEDDQTHSPRNPASSSRHCDISILGHPVGRPIVFPSSVEEKRSPLSAKAELTETLVSITEGAGGEGSVVAIQRAISQAVDLAFVKEDPDSRALFCEAIEAVSFNEGPLREAAMEAVTVLVDCLEESVLAGGDAEVDRSTASSALGALWNLSFNEGNGDSTTVPTVDLINSAKQAMLAFTDDPVVQTNASGLLVNLASDRQGQREVLNTGCLEALVEAVSTHSDNVALLEHTCQLLAMIASRKDLRAQLPKQYCVQVLPIADQCSDTSVRRWANWLRSTAAI